jgi:hypothetical protein
MLWFSLVGFQSSVFAESVAMITDIQGYVMLTHQNKRQPAQILDNLTPGDQIEVTANSKATIVYLDSSNEFLFDQSTLIIKENKPQLLKGKLLKSNSLLINSGHHNVKIKPINVDYMMVIMRSSNAEAKLKFLTLNGSRTSMQRPLFKWKPIFKGLTYHFELLDNKGSSLLNTWVKGTELMLPEHIHLQSGKTYSWEVSVELPNGRAYSNFADFAMISQTEKKRLAQLRPQKNASFSKRLVYATILEQMKLMDDAGAYWKLLAEERPSQQRLRKMIWR